MEAVYVTMQSVRKAQLYNLRTFRHQPLKEISGSFGDLGTLLPILIALTNQESVSISSTLVFTGLANILTGILFGIPLPVQPMKAIAAVALAEGFTKAQTASAGLFVAGVIGFLSITGLLTWFTRRIPIPVIKGIQIGAGLSLIISAGTTLLQPALLWSANWIVVILAFLLLLSAPMFPRMPYALLMLLVGILLPVGSPHYGSLPVFTIWNPHAFAPSPSDFRTGSFNAGLGQLPLTTLNSVIAVASLSADLLPDVPAPSVTSLGISVMAMNLVSCWFGSMPVCHGSGGLAAQYRFGARSGASIIFLGLIKLLLGLFTGNFAKLVFEHFSKSLLGILVIAAGLELANVGESLNTAGARDLRQDNERDVDGSGGSDGKKIKNLTDEEKRRRWTVMLMTVGGLLAFKNDAIGFLAGILCHGSFLLNDWKDSRTARRTGSIRLVEEGSDASASSNP
ncbi:hypothetical protein MMC12_006382 [Toensbergia leucococca]|nr:hypothetical protein [Toensbergia leucococca]